MRMPHVSSPAPSLSPATPDNPAQPGTPLRWWHRLIGRDDKFFDLLNAAAQEVRTSARLLSDYLERVRAGESQPPIDELAESRRRQKQIRTATIDELYKTLVPPFDREDIQALAFALYRIPKVIEKLAERISIYPGRLPPDVLRRQAELLIVAAESIVFMVEHLYPGADINVVTEANARLQAAEGEADKMMLGMLQELYSGGYGAKEVVILQSLYEIMEKAVDRCRNAGNIMVRIMLKTV
jgi:uncharacterized protein Yka (UPF0111/DUF47 family)